MADRRAMFGRLPRLSSSLLCFAPSTGLPPEDQLCVPRLRRWKDSDRGLPALALIRLAFRRLRSRVRVGLIALASFRDAADFAHINEVDRYFNALKTVVDLFTTELQTAIGAAQAVDVMPAATRSRTGTG